jgi:hypothetical protein
MLAWRHCLTVCPGIRSVSVHLAMLMYPGYCIRHSNPILLVSFTSCFFPLLPVLSSSGLSHISVLSFLNRNPHLGFISGETVELDDLGTIISFMPHLARHPEGIRARAQFWNEESLKRVWSYGTAWLWESTWSLEKSKWDQMQRIIDSVIRCKMSWDHMRYKIRYKLSTQESPEHILLVTPSISITPLSVYNRRCSVTCSHPWFVLLSPSLSLLLSGVAVVVRNRFFHHSGGPRNHSY